MTRFFRLSITLLLLLGLVSCRDEAVPSGGSGSPSAVSESAAGEEEHPNGLEPLRAKLDRIQSAIPIYPGASLRDGSRDQSRFDLVTNDSFPMVWHYYVLYLEQYRGWDHPAPFPRPRDSMRQLTLELDEIMKDPFIPDTALPEDAPRITIELRELPANRGVAIQYRFEERPTLELPSADEDPLEAEAGFTSD